MRRELLISLRKAKGISQKELAEKFGLTQQWVSGIELGKRTPHVKIMKELEEYFGVPMELLFPDAFKKETESTA